MKRYYYSAVGVSCVLAIVAVFLPFVGSSVSDVAEDVDAPRLPLSVPAVELEPKTASMIFFGDMMLGRHVETLTTKHGEDYLFEKIKAIPQIKQVVRLKF